MAQVQNDSGFFLAEANAVLKDGIDIAVGPCSVRVPAQAVADARAGWNALRAEAGEDAAQRIYEAVPATLPQRLEREAGAAFTFDRHPDLHRLGRRAGRRGGVGNRVLRQPPLSLVRAQPTPAIAEPGQAESRVLTTIVRRRITSLCGAHDPAARISVYYLGNVGLVEGGERSAKPLAVHLVVDFRRELTRDFH